MIVFLCNRVNPVMIAGYNPVFMPGFPFLYTFLPTDYGHPERAFFQKFEIFGLGQTNWAENLWGIWAISGQTISTILALWVPYPWESVAGPLSYKKLWFLGLKHITPKYSQNKIWAVQNLENSVRTSVFGGICNWQTLSWGIPLFIGIPLFKGNCTIKCKSKR